MQVELIRFRKKISTSLTFETLKWIFSRPTCLCLESRSNIIPSREMSQTNPGRVGACRIPQDRKDRIPQHEKWTKSHNMKNDVVLELLRSLYAFKNRQW